jgi:hypothetical protein
MERFADKEPEYFLKGIGLLILRCKKCVEIKGDYILFSVDDQGTGNTIRVSWRYKCHKQSPIPQDNRLGRTATETC